MFLLLYVGTEITSWEEFNYILVGLVDQLIELGAKPELKLTALQLWTSYLRLHEVAFFAKKDPKLPKLGAFFKKKFEITLCIFKRLKLNVFSCITETLGLFMA